MNYLKYLLPLILLACATTSSFKRAENPKALSQSEAELRGKSLSDLFYKMEISLDKESMSYKGKQNITFQLNKVYPLRLDFIEGEVESVVINGQKVAEVEYNESWVTLPQNYLKLGGNHVTVAFSHKFSNRGAGLHRFKDPADGRVYTYTDFEPFDANKFAPFFDQPDLKARYELLVRAPKDWTVISSTYADNVMEKGDFKVWNFPQSEIFSTYIFSLHAGPYKVWTDVYVDEKRGQRIPLDIYARRSMAKYLAPEIPEWFEVTKQGFEFFQDFFGTNYPYKKYAQLMVPEFNSGAMENVAAVTFNERAIHRSAPTYAERRGRSNTVLHEMAHMWFGNLVTMKWWDNLWLNESFATFMAYLALEKNTIFKDSFENFYASTKQWAYWNDDQVITHPILGDVANTDEAMLNFDGITYGKGASVLKQLYFYLGEENFKKGLKLYFDRHAGRNTVLKDFFAAFEEVSKIDLDPWVAEWLKTAGTNKVKAEYSCKEGKIETFTVKQSFKEGYPHLRTHKTLVALLNKKDKELIVSDTIKIEYSGESTSFENLVGRTCPELVFMNYKDYDFVKVQFAENDLKAMKEDLSGIKDNMTRLMAYNSLEDMVKDGELSLRTYTEMIIPHLAKEKSLNVATKGIFGLGNVVTFLFKKEVIDEKLIATIEDFFWEQANKVKDIEIKRQYFNAFNFITHTPKALAKIESLFLGKIKVKGVPFGIDQKWSLLQLLADYNHPKTMTYLEQLKKEDDSDRGKRNILAVEASIPALGVKKKWYENAIAENGPYSLKELGSALFSLFPRTQKELKKKVTTQFYVDLKKYMLDKPIRMQRMFTGSFIPTFCDQQSSHDLKEFIEGNEDLPVGIVKSLKISLQENDRCINVIY
jgi:aminopeptidase N